MDPECSDHLRQGSIFRLFTKESLTRIERRIAEAKAAKEAAKEEEEEAAEVTKYGHFGRSGKNEKKEEEDKPRPNPALEAGKPLPPKLGEFPPELYGKPIEDLDEFYDLKYTFMVVGRDKTMFRFSATSGFFLLSPFNPVRRGAIFTLTHPAFGLFVMMVILVNCVFMAVNKEIKYTEEVFTAIYTCEGTVKMLARGFILSDFTYLRDAWNWLDFIVVTLAYVTIMVGEALGNLAALRTFRVLRALKTVAVVPGLKTIVGALMEAVRRLRDVMILTVFVLSIFALIGLQIYQGVLKHKCIKIPPPHLENFTWEELRWTHYENESNWWRDPETNETKLCGEGDDAGQCPDNTTHCRIGGPNPNYDFTSFDSFGWAMLCAFRLMTQDFWENLYQIIIRCAGPWHMLFFILVIFMGSFYLVNLILAIVAMSYDEQQKQDQEDAEEEEEALAEEEARQRAAEAEAARVTPSDSFSVNSDAADVYIPPGGVVPPGEERISIKSEYGPDMRRRLSIVNSRGKKASLSLPGSPFQRRNSKTSQFSWRKKAAGGGGAAGYSPHGAGPGDRHPILLPYLDNLNLPYADDSAAVTPTSEDLCNPSSATHHFLAHRRRPSSTSYSSVHRGMSPHGAGASFADRFLPNSRRSSFASHHSRHSYVSHMGELASFKHKNRQEPTVFQFNTSMKHRAAAQPLLPEVIVDKTKSDDNQAYHQESSSDGSECGDTAAAVAKGKLFPDNPFICRTPSATMVDMKDVMVLKDLINHASGKPRRSKFSFMSQDGKTKKEIIKEKCLQLIFGWECSPCYNKFAHLVELFILDAFVDLFITLCIVVNTIFMALDQYGMSKEMEHTLVTGNYVFTTIFTAEAILKIIALSPINYLKDKWNCFDIVIVVLSLVELGLANVKGLSILRSFRLLRVFKLAKSWPTLNLLIGIIGRTMGALGNLCFVLAIIIFIFAVMGMQLFGMNYKAVRDGGPIFDETPRWNFLDFLHSFMIVFRVLCGEWIESMWDCIWCTGYICIPFFLLTMVIGSLVVLNLFLALLLSSFGAESLQQSQDDSEPNKLQEAVDRINRFIIFVKSHIMYCIKVKIKKTPIMEPYDQNFLRSDHTEINSKEMFIDGQLPMRNGRICEHGADPHSELGSPGEHRGSHHNEPSEDGEKACDGSTRPASMASTAGSTAKVSAGAGGRKSPSCESKHSQLLSDAGGDNQSMVSSRSNVSYSKADPDGVSFDRPIDTIEGPEINEVIVKFVKYPDECCPQCCVRRSRCCETFDATSCGKKWWAYRCYMFKLVEHNYFESFIIFMILVSSLALAVEDVYITDRPILEKVLKYMDKCFTVIFVFEMIIKWSAYGFKKYFTDAWCWLDFIIVAISLISLGAEGAGLSNIGAFRALRTLRALRPLRAVSRWEGMKVVVNALIQAIPSIFNVLMVCLVFWLIFAIMGVQLFGGRYHKCVDFEGNRLNATLVPNKTVCLSLQHLNYTWENSPITFDNVMIAYLALLQVATFKGWIDIMSDAIDSKELDQQPEYEVRVGMYLYFVFFIVFGSFFTLNLFIGVIIDNFNMQKKKGGSLEMFMTDDQKKYYNAMKKLGSKAPQKPIPKPKLKCQLFFFKLTTNQKFDIGIMSVIMMNMITMSLEHYDQSKAFEDTLAYINQVFIAIFTLECIMKIIGLRQYYFKQPWNIFDFVVVIFSVLALGLSDFIQEYFVSPTLLRVIRVFRVGRVLRLVKSAKGIRTLLFSLAVSLPALFNIGLLLFLVMFIYAIFGMSFFMHVVHYKGVDDMFNFETFGRSMIVLFQISTSAGWDGVLLGLMNEDEEICSREPTRRAPNGNCGWAGMGILYIVTYLVISFLVIINMYIAVILENFSQATEDVQQGLTQDDFDMYYEIWEKYDETACQYIPLDQLPNFVNDLEEPLQLPHPNYFKLVQLDIPICENDRVHCVDILDALTKNFLGTGGDEAGELGDIKKGPERPDYNPISSTRKRQREIVCARIVQKAWREFVALKKGTSRIAAEQAARKFHATNAGTAIVDIEEENEEDVMKENALIHTQDDEKKQLKEEEKKQQEGEEKKDNEKEKKGKDGDDSDSGGEQGGDSRTIELYPESGVVA